jgi:hypothetical protein
MRTPQRADIGASMSLFHDVWRKPRGKLATVVAIAGLALTGTVAVGVGESVVNRSRENTVYDIINKDGESALAAFDHGKYRGLKVTKVTPKAGQTLMGFAVTVAEHGDVENVRNLGAAELGGSDLQGQPLIFPEGMVQDQYEDSDQRPEIEKPADL